MILTENMTDKIAIPSKACSVSVNYTSEYKYYVTEYELYHQFLLHIVIFQDKNVILKKRYAKKISKASKVESGKFFLLFHTFSIMSGNLFEMGHLSVKLHLGGEKKNLSFFYLITIQNIFGLTFLK